MPTHTRRRQFIKGSGLTVAGMIGMAGCLSDDETANGDTDFPSETVEFVVPYGSGGYDTYTRTQAPYVMEHLPGEEEHTVNNIQGGGGHVGLTDFISREGDSHSVQLINVMSFSQDQTFGDVDFDITNLTWYPQIAQNLNLIAVGSNTDVESVEDFVDGINSGSLMMTGDDLPDGGSTAVVMTGMISGLYEGQTVVENHTVFDGRGEQITAMMRGDVQYMAGDFVSLLPYVESGDLRPILVCTAEEEPPHEMLEDTPTLLTSNLFSDDEATEIQDAVSGRRIWAGPPEVPETDADIMRDALIASAEDEDFLADADEADLNPLVADHEAAEEAVTNLISTLESYSDEIESAFYS